MCLLQIQTALPFKINMHAEREQKDENNQINVQLGQNNLNRYEQI